MSAPGFVSFIRAGGGYFDFAAARSAQNFAAGGGAGRGAARLHAPGARRRPLDPD